MILFQKIFRLIGFSIIVYVCYYTFNAEKLLFLEIIKIPDKPLWGIIHLNSLIFVLGILMGITITYFDTRSIIFFTKFIIFVNVPAVGIRLYTFKKKMKFIADKYYTEGVDSISKADLKKLPRVLIIIINQLQMRIPIDDIFKIIDRREKRYIHNVEDSISILTTLSSVAPSVGVMGTVIGLIKLLANLKDPGTIGPNMSVALMTTLYGLFFSNLIFSPLRRLIIEFENYASEIYEEAKFFLKIIKENKPSFYCDEDYNKLSKKK